MMPRISPTQPALSRRSKIFLETAILLVIFLAGFWAIAWRIDQAPDIFTDEILYTRMSIRTGGEGALVWDSGEPFLVHPPLYFILQGLFTAVTGDHATPLYSAGDIFVSVYHARYLNAVLAGLTGVVMYLLGKRAHSRLLGLVLAGLFVLDPFGVRINRRAMLETLAGLLTMTGMWVYLSVLDQPERLLEGAKRTAAITRVNARIIMTGLLFGCALLAKELTFTTLLALLLYSGWEVIRLAQRSRLNRTKIRLRSLMRTASPALWVSAIAGLTYLTYPVWVAMNGDFNRFWDEKFLGLRRLAGLVHLSGWNRPGVSLMDYIIQRMSDYGSSYILLGLGGLSLVGLLIWARWRLSARLVIAWGAILYPFYAFVALAGSGNDQFFYFLLLPAMVLTAFATITLPDLTRMMIASKRVEHPVYLAGAYLTSMIGKFSWIVLLALVLSYNIFRWSVVFGFGTDNGYQQMSSFITSHLPAGVSINASGDPIKYHYFLPDYEIFAEADPQDAINKGIHYFALAPKDVQFRYGKISAELADWITTNGTPLFSYRSYSYGDLFLYRVDYQDNLTAPVESDLVAGGAHWRSFQAAGSGRIDLFIQILALWLAVWLGLALGPALWTQLRPTERDAIAFDAGAIPAHSYETSDPTSGKTPGAI